MKPSLAWLSLLLIWAALYLPGLGNMELKGEEPRRALPALEMLQTGDWIVPHINGEPYLRKPPLINWLIAGAMRATHSRAEWAVRLPSVLTMLAMAAVIFATARRWMPLSAAWMAAVISLSGIGLWEKGRLAEIEAVYVALTGIAFALWLEAWANRRTGWRLWLAPMIFLGLCLLAKGPFHLLFFYAVAIPILIAAREKRELLRWPHLASLALAGAIFAAWAIPYFHATSALNTESVWASQVQQRLGGGDRSALNLITNFLNSLANGLPWILFAPLWWNRRILSQLDDRHATLIRAARWPLALGFSALTLIPGMLPRYTLPLYPAAALLLALALPALAPAALISWRWANRILLTLAAAGLLITPWIIHAPHRDWLGLLPLLPLLLLGILIAKPQPADAITPSTRQTFASALVMAAAIGIYAAFILPKYATSAGLRQAGAEIDAAAPEASSLVVVDPGYQPILFYVTRPHTFIQSALETPPGTEYLLMDKADRKKAKKGLIGGTEIATFGQKDKKQLVLVKLK